MHLMHFPQLFRVLTCPSYVFYHLQWISLHDFVLIYQGTRPNTDKQTSSTRPNTYCNHEFKQLLANVHLCWPHLINQYHTFPWLGGKIRVEAHLTHHVPVITHAEMMPTCIQVNHLQYLPIICHPPLQLGIFPFYICLT